MDWKKLKEYRCPVEGCGYPLKQKDGLISQETYHKCTNPKCNFHISDKKLTNLVVVRHRKLEPPAFIEEMRNQEGLNDL